MKEEVLIDLGEATEVTMAPHLTGDVPDGEVDEQNRPLWVRFDG